MSAAAPPSGVSATGDDPHSDDTRRRRWPLVLIALAFGLVLLGSVGVLYDGNLVWLNRLEHPFLFGCVAAVAFGVGVCELIATHWLRVLVAAVTTMVAGAWLLIGLTWVSITGASLLPAATASAPGDHEYKAVVYKGQDVLGETWYGVSIQQTHGLLSREWLAGCLSNGESRPASLYQVRWQSPSRLRVTLDWAYGSSITVSVDPRTGQPESPRASC